MGTFKKLDFLLWVERNNLLYRNFLEIAKRLEGFIISKVLEDSDRAKMIALRLEDVLRNCDEITYDEEGSAEAYAILHFLDRYHRFQLIYIKMLELDLLTINRSRIDNLDVGTGPAPALFALSDMYSLIKEYCSSNEVTLADDEIEIVNDYVERSYGFRDWLHHFTEYANYIQTEVSDKFYNVPYHHGKFNDFQGIEFDQERYYYDYDDDGDQYRVQWIEKTRNNLVIFSNFMTNNETTEKFSDELYKSALYLRNKGIILIVGARSSSEKYKHVYEKLDDIICKGKYTNHRFIGSCKRVELVENLSQMSYSYDSQFGVRIKSFISEVLSKFEEKGATEHIPKNVLEILNKTIKSDYSYIVTWELHVYQKKSRPRKYNKGLNFSNLKKN